jgi:hypothetical protein
MAALHEGLVFDTARGTVLDASRRYVLLRADVLMGLFARPDGDARDAALASAARSPRTAPTACARTAPRSAAAPPAMVEDAAASARLGPLAPRPRPPPTRCAAPALGLAVENSPFAPPRRPARRTLATPSPACSKRSPARSGRATPRRETCAGEAAAR